MKTKNVKINVLHLVLSLDIGGLERLVSELALLMDKERYNVEVCCLDRLGAFSDNLIKNGIKVHLLQRNQNHYDYLFAFKLMKLLRNRSVHVLHMHSGTFFHGTQAGYIARTPVMVYTDHGRDLVESNVQLLTDKISGYLVHKIFAVSHELERYLIDVVKLPAGKMATIINGINTEEFAPRMKSVALLEKLNINMDCKIVGTVGRLVEVKDQMTMITAFKRVKDIYPNSIFMIVGDGPLLEALKNMVFNNDLDRNVIFLRNRNDIAEILNIMDVFLLTSLSEGTSVALLEAMSSGVPAIVTDVGGNPSIVDDGINGFLIKPKQTELLSELILRILGNNEIREKLSNNAVSKIHSDYCMFNMIENYSSSYTELLAIRNICI